MNQRGVVLAGVLFMSIVMLMFITAAVELSPGSLASGRNLEHSLGALRAAQAGLQYAQCRLREDALWRGGEGGPTTVVNLPEFVVVEAEGNVVGLMRSDVGEWSQFRIRFNYQNGNMSDGRPDPPSDYELETPHVSVNNLSSTATVDLPLPQDAPYAVLPSSPKSKVPAYSVCLKIEGRSGDGLRDLSPSDPNGTPIAGRPVVSRVVEAFVKADNSDVLNSAAMAGGSMQLDLLGTSEGKLQIHSHDGKVSPRTRSKLATSITGGTGTSDNLVTSQKGQIKTEDGTISGTPIYDTNKISPQVESDADPFYSLQWDDVKKANATPSATDAVHLKAGTYVWGADGKLHYYDMDLADYKTAVATALLDPLLPGPGPGLTLSANLSEVRLNMGTVPDPGSGSPLIQASGSGTDATLTLREDVAVKATANSSGFAMIPRGGAVEGPPDLLNGVVGKILDGLTPGPEPENIHMRFQPRKRCTFSTEGDVYLGAKVEGDNGSITTAGNLKLVGGGDLAAPLVGMAEVGVNMYAKGDITLNSYDEKNGSNSRYKDFKLAGVIYAWGDFTFEGGRDASTILPGYAMGEQGKLDLTGALVAYGRDPALGDPDKLSGKGNVRMKGRHVKLTYDSAYIGGLRQSLGVGRLRVCSWSEK